MKVDCFRFPHTPHVAWLGEGKPRDDKVLTPGEAMSFLSHPIVVEEKVDGANLGIWVDHSGSLRVQNRGSYLIPPYAGQFDRLNGWLAAHVDTLFDVLGDGMILFGEWCAVRHSLDYTGLPDWFLGFDVYDREARKFFSARRRDELFLRAALKCVSRIGEGRYTLSSLQHLLYCANSAYRRGPLEGLYLRSEDDQWVHARAKLVRREFTQAISTHWRRRNIERNQIDAAVESKR